MRPCRPRPKKQAGLKQGRNSSFRIRARVEDALRGLADALGQQRLARQCQKVPGTEASADDGFRRLSPRAMAGSQAKQAGFSLITMSIVLTIASIIFVSFLPGKDAGDVNNKQIESIKKLERVEEAMRSFMAFNGRRPCPADGSSAINTATYGAEAGAPGACATAPLGPDAGTGHVVGGTIPTRALGLPDEYAFDEWGRRFTYVVDLRATIAGSSTGKCLGLQNYPSNNGTGGIKIESTNGGTVLANTMYAYISHGPDGFGAFPEQGSTVGGRINTGSTDADQRVNAGVDASFNYSTSNFTNVKVQKTWTKTFDDLVWVRPDLENTCCIGPVCSVVGFRIDSVTANENLGDPGYTNTQIAVGDINNDGIPDLILGSYQGNKLYVIFGTTSGFPNPLPVNTLNGSNGFVFQGGGGFGQYASVGDIDGDGIPDIITSDNYLYYTAVLYGHANPWPAVVDTHTWTAGTDGFELRTSEGGGEAFHFVKVGDVNGDGKGDLILTNEDNNSGTGKVYVVFGHAKPWAALLDVSTLMDGTNGFAMTGGQQTSYLGTYGVATADLNGDGAQDILISEMQHWTPTYEPRVYVVYGQKPWPAATSSIALGSLNGTNGFRIYQTNSGGQAFGAHMNVADVNNDGYLDMIIPCSDCNGSSGGNVYVVWGKAGAWAASNNIDTLVSGGGANYFQTFDRQASWATAVGDINGDGIPDILINAAGDIYSNPADVEHVYVVFGHTGAWSNRSFQTTPLTGGSDGVLLDCPSMVSNSGYGCGFDLGVGDLNGDGIKDIIVADPWATSQGQALGGWVYVLFGKASQWPAEYSLSNVYNGP